MFFDAVLIVGSGKIACDCSSFLHSNGVEHVVIESDYSKLSMLRMVCKKNGTNYICINDNLAYDLDTLVIQNSKGRTLVISANNPYIFKSCLDKENILAINFHYGLLPEYRGMNIPSWVIYNNEKYTGSTWHYVNKSIDSGSIIAESSFEIKESDTALLVAKKDMIIGFELFKSFILDFLSQPFCKISSQNKEKKESKSYIKKEIPAKGVFDINESAAQLVRLLKAFDYGAIEYIPNLVIYIDSNKYRIVSYEVTPSDKEICEFTDKLEFCFTKEKLLFKLKLKKSSED